MRLSNRETNKTWILNIVYSWYKVLAMNNTNSQIAFFFYNLVSDQIDTRKDSYFVKQK